MDVAGLCFQIVFFRWDEIRQALASRGRESPDVCRVHAIDQGIEIPRSAEDGDEAIQLPDVVGVHLPGLHFVVRDHQDVYRQVHLRHQDVYRQVHLRHQGRLDVPCDW